MGEDLSGAHERNRAQYARVAEAYAVSASHAGGDDLSWFAARAASVVPGPALDVACGGGFSTRALIGAGHRVVATDLTPESVAAARAATDGGALGWVSGAAERLPIRTASVALVACRIAPHHFADVARFVDEAARVLMPGGMLLVVDSTVPEDDELDAWLNEVERLRDPSHGRSWPPSRWRAVVAGARLDVVETLVLPKRHDVASWLERAGCDGARADEVRARFRDAPAAVRAAFRIEVDDGEAVAYTDGKLCLRAVKRAG